MDRGADTTEVSKKDFQDTFELLVEKKKNACILKYKFHINMSYTVNFRYLKVHLKLLISESKFSGPRKFT